MARARDGRSRGSPTRSRRPRIGRDGVRATRHGDLVLVATDDPTIRRQLCHRLDDQGYRAVVADSSTRVDEIAALVRPVVILFDVDGADGQALAVLGRIRAHSSTPVIVLSTRAAEGDKVAVLDAGADDYVAKPFSANELLARVRVAARYARSRPAGDETYAVGPIQIDTIRYQVTVDGKPVHLTPIEFRLLALLARSRGAVVTREQILQEIWRSESDDSQLLRVHIASLRKKIEAESRAPTLARHRAHRRLSAR